MDLKTQSSANSGQTRVSRNRECSSLRYPLISIITVVKNGEKLLEETILSVLGQTYPNIEYIIIDGASTDGTVNLIRQYEQQIDCWISEPDSGVSAAFNRGLQMARGTWINFMNAGDVFIEAETVEQVSQHFGRSKIVAGFAQFGLRTIPKRLISNQEPLQTRSMISHQATFVHRSVFQTVGHFDESYRLRMDYEFWLRALKQYDVYLANQVFVDYDACGMSGRAENIWQFYQEEKKANITHEVPSTWLTNLRVSIKCYVKILLSQCLIHL